MNFPLKRILLYSAMASAMTVTVACTAQPLASGPPSAGTINLYNSSGALQCSFEAISRYENLETSQNCGRVENGFIYLNSVPSTTKIWLLYGHYTNQLPPNPYRYCTLQGDRINYGFELRTIKEPTTLPDKLRIADIKTFANGDVVLPGLRLINKIRPPSGEPNISCLIVEGAQ